MKKTINEIFLKDKEERERFSSYKWEMVVKPDNSAAISFRAIDRARDEDAPSTADYYAALLLANGKKTSVFVSSTDLKKQIETWGIAPKTIKGLKDNDNANRNGGGNGGMRYFYAPDKGGGTGGGNDIEASQEAKRRFSKELDKFIANGYKGDKPLVVSFGTPAVLQEKAGLGNRNITINPRIVEKILLPPSKRETQCLDFIKTTIRLAAFASYSCYKLVVI